MEKWEIIYFEKIDSTQKYLLENLDKFTLPVCIWSEFQTAGVGTRNRKWIGKKGNLFFSFAVYLDEFKFIPKESLSIYFAYVLFEVLRKYKKNLIIKWPNDIYILEESPKKIAGILVNIKKDICVCGIGVNTKFNPFIKKEYESGCLGIDEKNDKILNSFLDNLKKYSWNEVFRNYKFIFEKSKKIFNIRGELDYNGFLKG